MSFLNPLFLAALLAVALPLVIHLLNFKRPKKIRFSTLAFFKELQQSTIRRIKIKRYLLLALRMLAIVCLALVLARPFLPPNFGFMTNSKEPAVIALLLDNSISMGRVGQDGPLIEQAKKVMDDIVSSSGDEDQFLLQVTNGQALNSSVLSAGQLRRELEKPGLSLTGNYTAGRLAQLLGVLNESPFENKKLFFITDGSLPVSEELKTAASLIPRNVSATFIQLGEAVVQNTYVSGITSSTTMIGAGAPYDIRVNVTNGSTLPASNQFLSLAADDKTLGQYPLELRPGETQTFAFSLIPEKTGSLNGKLIVEGDEFVADNTFYFTIEVPDKRQILLVRDKAAVGQDFSFTAVVLDAPIKTEARLIYDRITTDELAATNLGAYDAVVLEEPARIPEFAFENLQNFVQSGKGVVLFPSQTADIKNYNEFLNLFNAGKVGNIAGEFGSGRPVALGTELLQDHPVFADLFEQNDESDKLTFAAPNIYYYLKLVAPESGTVLNLISLNTKEALVREKQFGQGKVIFSAIGNGPGWSDFPVKALYSPFYYRTLLYASASNAGGFSVHTLGNKFVWEGNFDAQNTELIAGGHSIRVVPQNLGGRIRLEYSGEDLQAGWIEVSDGGNSAFVAANIPARESDFSQTEILGSALVGITTVNFINAGMLNTQQLAESIKSSGFGREIWSWFLMAGLLFLVAESLVSVYFKAETIA